MGKRVNTKPQRTSLQTFLGSMVAICEAGPPVVTRHAARASFHELRDDVALMRLRGPVTAAVLGQFMREMVKRYSDSAAAFIIDFSGALVLASAPDLVAAVPTKQELRRSLPWSFVETAEQEETLVHVSLRLARSGCPARRFYTLHQAHAWALSDRGV